MDSDPLPVPNQIAMGFLSGKQLPQTSKKRKGPPRVAKFPDILDSAGPDSNHTYHIALNETAQLISPQTLGFMPSSYWLNTSLSFGALVAKFFHRKNNASCRFPHKLYNALLLVENDPTLFSLVGVKWLTNEVFLVDKFVFGRLLGIASFDGGLFHWQGNFPSHGFIELTPDQIAGIQSAGFDPSGVDHDRYHVLRHAAGQFTRAVSEEVFEACKWTAIL
jgi:hypothetical protein